jgi:hypothetical protein
MGGVRKLRRQGAGPFVKFPGPSSGSLAGEGKLAAAHVADFLRGRFPPELLKKSLQIEFPAFRIF